MGLFGKSENQKQYEQQLEVTARQQAEAERQLAVSKAYQEDAQRQHQQNDEDMQRSRQLQDRYAKLLDIWEAQARRFDAILTKWEARG